METALLAVIAIGIGSDLYLTWRWYRAVEMRIESARQENFATGRNIRAAIEALEDLQNAVEEDLQLKARQSQPIKPLPSGPLRVRRFPTIASRRAQAETQSMSATTHSAAVVENNTKAMEAR